MRPWIVLLALAARSTLAAQSADCGAAPYDCAVTYLQRGEFARAVAVLEPLTATASDKLKTLNLLGIALTGAGRVDEANNRFHEALDLDSTFYPALKNLAVNEFT